MKKRFAITYFLPVSHRDTCHSPCESDIAFFFLPLSISLLSCRAFTFERLDFLLLSPFSVSPSLTFFVAETLYAQLFRVVSHAHTHSERERYILYHAPSLIFSVSSFDLTSSTTSALLCPFNSTNSVSFNTWSPKRPHRPFSTLALISLALLPITSTKFSD